MIGYVDTDIIKNGRSSVFDLEEESKIVNHLQAVAKYRYGYIHEDVVEIATDYCVRLGKRASNNPLTGFGDLSNAGQSSMSSSLELLGCKGPNLQQLWFNKTTSVS